MMLSDLTREHVTIHHAEHFLANCLDSLRNIEISIYDPMSVSSLLNTICPVVIQRQHLNFSIVLQTVNNLGSAVLFSTKETLENLRRNFNNVSFQLDDSSDCKLKDSNPVLFSVKIYANDREDFHTQIDLVSVPDFPIEQSMAFKSLPPFELYVGEIGIGSDTKIYQAFIKKGVGSWIIL